VEESELYNVYHAEYAKKNAKENVKNSEPTRKWEKTPFGKLFILFILSK
jgi:hypothetical protein